MHKHPLISEILLIGSFYALVLLIIWKVVLPILTLLVVLIGIAVVLIMMQMGAL